jgi:ribose transport system permease protein
MTQRTYSATASSRGISIQRFLNERTTPALGAAALLIVLIIVDVLMQPGLLSVFQLGLMLQTALTAILIAAAQTFAVVVRGLDLSVGGVLALGSVLCSTFLDADAAQLAWRLPVVIVLGAVAGTVNGLLIAVLKVQPVVGTLATWSIFDGIALLILPTAGGKPPAVLSDFTLGGIGDFSNSFIILIVLLIAWGALKRTRFGTHLYAVGSDEKRAQLNGVPITRVKVLAYTASGILSIIAGIYLASTTASGDPTIGDPYLLTSIVAVVVGGTSLLGGEGGVGLTVLGALTLTVLTDIITANNLDTSISIVASSVLLLFAVAVRQILQRRRKVRL